MKYILTKIVLILYATFPIVFVTITEDGHIYIKL